MYKLFCLLLISCLSSYVYGADFVKGYIVMPAGDTVFCQIKISGSKATNYTRVTINTTEGEEITYSAKDGEVKAYGIFVGSIRSDYTYFELKPKVESRFYKLLINGPKYKLYYIIETADMGSVVASSPKYVLVNNKGEFNFFGTCALCGWRKRIEALVADDAFALEKLPDLKIKEVAAYINSINNTNPTN